MTGAEGGEQFSQRDARGKDSGPPHAEILGQKVGDGAWNKREKVKGAGA